MFNLLKGLLFGLAYVAPIGMQNLYVINTALDQPRHRAYLIAGIVIFFDISLSLACFFWRGSAVNGRPPIKITAVGGWRLLYHRAGHPADSVYNHTFRRGQSAKGLPLSRCHSSRLFNCLAKPAGHLGRYYAARCLPGFTAGH